jgi:hypothetical protein
MDLKFASIGKVPRVSRTEAYVFHDDRGTIRHVHQHIVLEGARPRPVDAMLDEVRAHAASYGNDVGKLKMLHIPHALDPSQEYRVDVKRGALVGRAIAQHAPLKRVADAGKVRTTRKKARKKR